MDKFSDLEAFITVVDCGSFSAAAERLNVAKSAVSRRVGGLETRLGSRLLNRTTRRLSLTESGRVFYEQVRQILLDLDEAEQQVTDQQAALRGPIRLAAPLSFGHLHLGPPIAEFVRLHPEIELEIDLNDRFINLVEEGYDLAIRIGQLQDSNLVARRVTDLRMITVASEEYLQRRGVPQTPADLEQHEGLEYDNLPRSDRWQYRNVQGEKQQPNVPVRVRANNGNLLLELAIAGQGVLRSPVFICGEPVSNGRLVRILADWEEPAIAMHVVYPPGRLHSRRVRVFSDFLVQWFRQDGIWKRNCPVDNA